MSANRSLFTLDTLDDRREIWALLHRLSPRARVSAVAWACSRVRTPSGRQPVVSSRLAPTVRAAHACDRADDRLTNELYGDLLALAANWDLDLGAVAVELQRRARGGAA